MSQGIPHQPEIGDQGRPDTATLCNELASVSDWRMLGLYLGVQDYELDQIEKSHLTGGCIRWKQETFSLWLRHTPSASWRDVVGALRQMGENTEAERIELKYNGGCVHTSVPDVLNPPVAIAQCNIQMIQGKFSLLVTTSRRKLQGREISVEDVKTFLVTMYSSRNSRNGSDVVTQVLESAKTLDEIFRALGKYGLWDYLNYYLLQNIIKAFAQDDDELNSEMKQYQRDLTGFVLVQRIQTFLDATHNKHPISTNDSDISVDENVTTLPSHQKHKLFKKLTVKVDANITDYSLSYVYDLWQSLVTQFDLPQPAMILHKVAKGCIGITWLIPVNLVEYITRMAQNPANTFTEKHIQRVMLEEQCIYPMDTKHSQPPLPETDPPLLETEPPLLETDPPLLETDPPLLETDPPLLETEHPLLETEHPLLETEPPLLETEPPPLETNPPLLETDPPLLETDPPLLETDPPLLETDPPLLETEPPLLETEPLLLETEPPLLETDQPPLKAEPPPLEAEPPLQETEPPLKVMIKKQHIYPMETEHPLTKSEIAALKKKAFGTFSYVPRKLYSTNDLDAENIFMETKPPLLKTLNPPVKSLIPLLETKSSLLEAKPESEALSMVPQVHRKRKLENDLEIDQPAPKRHIMNESSDSEEDGVKDHSNRHATTQSEDILPKVPVHKHGYECEIIDPPVWAPALPTNCPICLQVLRNPRQTNCGHIFCEVCIEALQEQICPECKQTNISTFPHESLRRLLNDLKVQCTIQDEERVCDWTGKLKELDDHLNLNPTSPDVLQTGCKFVNLQCEFSYIGCEAQMPRKHMVLHMEEQSYHIQLLADKVKKQARQIKKLNMKLQRKEEETACAIQQMQEEFTSKLKSKDEVIAQLMQQKQDTKSTPHVHQVNFCFTVDRFKYHMESEKEWVSEPFYTHPQGYKMCVEVFVSGLDTSKKYLSLYTCVMKGENDDKLSWPFYGKLTVQLLNQKSDEHHHVYTIHYDESIPQHYCERVLIGERNRGWGNHRFISHSKISQENSLVQYVKDDCIKFRISDVLLYD